MAENRRRQHIRRNSSFLIREFGLDEEWNFLYNEWFIEAESAQRKVNDLFCCYNLEGFVNAES